jgi:hypothetical protein
VGGVGGPGGNTGAVLISGYNPQLSLAAPGFLTLSGRLLVPADRGGCGILKEMSCVITRSFS